MAKLHLQVESARYYFCIGSGLALLNIALRFLPVALVGLFLPAQALADRYTYHWEIDETPQGAETANRIEPVKVVLLDEVVEVASHSAALQLREKYSVHLGPKWSAQQAHGLLRTFESVPQVVNWPYDEEPTVPASVWTLSTGYVQDDIAVKTRDGQRQVTVAQAAFTYANPLLAEIDGVRGRFFSKRLHRAVVRFATNNGKDRNALEHILQERYAVSVNVPDYRALTKHTTGEGPGRFMPFKNEELITLASMLEEYPSGMRHTPGLSYLVRRLDGTPHPLYPAAGAVAWTQSGYIEFMESAFKGAGAASINRLVLHEKAHFLWDHLFDEQLKADWIELGGWYRISERDNLAAQDDAEAACSDGSLLSLFDCFDSSAAFARPDQDHDWATTKQTEFVSAYAHAHNPNEDMAESIAFYIVNPDKLRSRSPDKYEFIQNRIMHGTRYISQIRADLTFQVYNLYPDYVYPGRIIRVDIAVEGKPQEDKQITIEIELHHENEQDVAQPSHVRIFAENGNFFDLWLDPIDKNGRRRSTGYILRGRHTLSKFAPDGYWGPDQIAIRDAAGNKRLLSQVDFGWKLFVDNPLADDTPPVYVPNSMKLSLSEAIENGRPYQVVTARWKLLEENDIKGVLVWLNDGDADTYSRRAEDWGDYDKATGQASVQLVMPDYYPSGTWKLNYLVMEDIALNSRGVYFTEPGHALNGNEEAIDERPATIQIKTKNPDTRPPTLDLNNITVDAEPTNPAAPNGETRVDISFRVKDNISGYRYADMLLRDPQGVEHFFRHWDNDLAYSVYFRGDPTAWATYENTIVLPVGSVPGIWGLAEMTVWDKAQNKLVADFTEIVRFEIDEAAGKVVAANIELLPNAPNPFNAQTVLSYFLPKLSFVRLELYNLMGQHVKTLYEGNQQAGLHQLRWDGTDKAGRAMASGTYLYRLATDHAALMQKLTLLR